MHTKNIITGITLLLMLAACRKTDVSAPDFTVSVPKTTYNVGDTVVFSFTGTPDFISFYPGTSGHHFDNRNRTHITGKPQLQFTSYKQYGTQLNSLQLKITSQLDAYSVEGIQSAEWTDITDRITLSTGANNTPSGVADISDLVTGDKPVYIAFRKVDGETLVPNTWTIREFVLDVLLPDGSLHPVAGLSSAGWTAVDLLNPAYKWTVSSTTLKCTGGRADPVNEDWLISSTLYPFNAAPDAAIPVKSYADNPAGDFQYIFETPGEYHVYFTATNATLYDRKEVVRDLLITVQ